MLSFTKIIAITALATAGLAATVKRGSGFNLEHYCPKARLVTNHMIEVGSHHLKYTSHSCGFDFPRGRGFLDYPPWCFFFHTCKPKPHPPPPPPPPPGPRNVCGANCTTSCNDNVGVLPPIEDDCQTIEDSIIILKNQTSPTFIVDANHLETLSFGTCSYFFQNTGSTELEYCWSDLSASGDAAGAACFPPVHPPFSEGLCTSDDGTWSVGAAHS